MRIRDPGLLRLLSFEHDECAVCRSPHQLHLHHVLFRSHGGDDVRANITPLCFECHEGYHTRRQQGYGLKLADHLEQNRPDTVAYLEQKLGKGGMQHWFAVNRTG